MITFFSDPHIGLNRQAGTTPATREIIRRNILRTLMDIPIPGRDVVCLGDLLDKYANNEEIIRDAAYIVSGLELCLAGNHDIKNTADSIGTLQLLQDTVESAGNIAINKFGMSGAHRSNIDGVDIISVPHCSTQDLFFDSLCQAEKMGGEILLLHCNFDAPAHRDLSETELNLTRENAEELLKTFKYILIGHEHNAAEHFGGRLKIVGGVYPTSFNDMKSKRYLTYEDGEFTSHETWSRDNYFELDWHEACAYTETEFIRLTGKRNQEDGKEFLSNLKVLRSSDVILAIKDDTILEDMQTEFASAEHPLKLSEMIRKALESHPEERALWDELQEKITHE